jgi:predicted amino acid racemase
MFLDLLRRRNPALLAAAAGLAIARKIPPNSFVLDIDTIRANGAALRTRADSLGLKLYFMTKQIGRNPLVTHALVAPGSRETVSVDIACADAFMKAGVGLGHVGNLVQTALIDIPEVITVFSAAKARQIGEEAVRQGIVQNLLLRVADPAHDLYLRGMEGGIPLDTLVETALEIARIPGVRIDGVSTFPAVSYAEAGEPKPTANFTTLRRARDVLEQQGIAVHQINAPGNTCVHTMPLQAQMGATHVEPGHGFLGTTPFHWRLGDLPERPAACYVTEVAHHVGDRAYVQGGGFFIDDPVWLAPDFKRRALVGSTVGELLDHEETLLGAGYGTSGNFGGIDYYGFLACKADRAPVGATVVLGYRIQSFATRADIAVIADAETTPRLLGVFDQLGNRLEQYDV